MLATSLMERNELKKMSTPAPVVDLILDELKAIREQLERIEAALNRIDRRKQ